MVLAACRPEAVLRLYSRRADVVLVAPNGTVNRGHAAITRSFDLLFPNIESMRGEVREVTYHRVSDSVVSTVGRRGVPTQADAALTAPGAARPAGAAPPPAAKP